MSAPSSATSSPIVTLRKVDPTRRMSSIKTTPSIATFSSFSLHINNLETSIQFFQSVFNWSIIRHEEMDTKDATGDGINNGAYSVTYMGPSPHQFTIALIYNYGIEIVPTDTSVHHIAITCDVEQTIATAKQHGYKQTNIDGDICIISNDGYAFKLIALEGEVEKPSVAYVSIFTKSLIRSSDYYTTVLSMSPSIDYKITTQFPADIKHGIYGYGILKEHVQLQLVQNVDMGEKRERVVVTCKDVATLSTKIKSSRNTILFSDSIHDITRDKDNYTVVIYQEGKWKQMMEQGQVKIDGEERARRLELTRTWMKSNPTPVADPIAHVVSNNRAELIRVPSPQVAKQSTVSPQSIERKSSLSHPSSRSSSPSVSSPAVSPSPSPTSMSITSASTSTASTASTSSNSVKLNNAKPAHTRLISTDNKTNATIKEYEETIELLQEQLLVKQQELNTAYEKIKNKMEQVKEIIHLKEDENQRLRQQLKDAGLTPIVPHTSIATLISTPVQQMRRLSVGSQASSRTSTPPPPPAGYVKSVATGVPTTSTTPPPKVNRAGSIESSSSSIRDSPPSSPAVAIPAAVVEQPRMVAPVQ